MITRVEQNGCLQKQIIRRLPPVNRLEKAMLSFASFKPAGKVLDANVRTGRVAEYLLSETDCQVCGISDRMEEIRQIRSRLAHGDFAYAAMGDIPWQDATFDTILLCYADGGIDALREQLKECSRVLCAGGQLVVGLRTLPPVLIKAGQILEAPYADEENLLLAEAVKKDMETCGFVNVTRHPVALSGCVLVGWRKS